MSKVIKKKGYNCGWKNISVDFIEAVGLDISINNNT